MLKGNSGSGRAQRWRRMSLLTLALMAVGAAGAQACVDREVEIEQVGVGVVRAVALEYEDDVAALQDACFELNGVTLDARRAQADETGIRAQQVAIRATGVTGTAASLATQGEDVELSDLLLDLELPTVSLPGLPLPPGRYNLQADQAVLGRDGALRFGAATLKQRATGETYRLIGAELRGQRLVAEQVSLSRIEARDVTAQPNSIRAGNTLIGLCRDPRGRELALSAEGLNATPTGTTLTNAQLRVFGFGLPTPSLLSLPVTARGDTLGESVSDALISAQLLVQRFEAFRPQLVIGNQRFGVRRVPLFDANNTLVNAVLHPGYLEFGMLTTYADAVVTLGIFQDPDVGEDKPLPVFAVEKLPDVGTQAVLAFRGSDELSEARYGHAWRAGLVLPGGIAVTTRAVGEFGVASQLTLADAFVRAWGSAELSRQAGHFILSARASLDAYRFVFGSQVSGELYGRAAYAGTRFAVSVEQLERRVWGDALLVALNLDPARTTLLSAAYVPRAALGPVELRAAGYVLGYDWLAQRYWVNALNVTLATRVANVDLVPTVSYSFPNERLTVSADVTLYSDCFAYGAVIDAYREPGRSGAGARFKFNLR